MTYTDFHSKYRPGSLAELIGHEKATTQLRGMIAKNNIPGALLFLGPSSVGKTTLARALSAEINGHPVEAQATDYREINAADTRSVEDMRELVKLSKFAPTNKRRIFVIDEAQQLISNAVAAQTILKPLEEASKSKTIWILCSMDPSKFTSGTGRAIANRCTQFQLEPHTNSDLLKQGMRIVRGEGMSYLDKEVVKEIVKASNGEMRTLANLVQSVRNYYEGLEGKKPKALDSSAILDVLKSSTASDDTLVAQVVVGALSGKYAQVHRALLDVSEPFQFVNKLMWAVQYQLSAAVLNGQRHPKIWPSQISKAIASELKVKPTLGQLAALNECVVNIKAQAGNFTVDETSLVSARLYRFIKENLA